MKTTTSLYPTVPDSLIRHFFNFALLAALSLALVGCGGAGGLLSNPRVSDADNDQVITIGDSIFALSGELQDFLEQRAGQTFRRYTLSGAELQGGFIATSIVDQYGIARRDNPQQVQWIGRAQ